MGTVWYTTSFSATCCAPNHAYNSPLMAPCLPPGKDELTEDNSPWCLTWATATHIPIYSWLQTFNSTRSPSPLQGRWEVVLRSELWGECLPKLSLLFVWWFSRNRQAAVGWPNARQQHLPSTGNQHSRCAINLIWCRETPNHNGH